MGAVERHATRKSHVKKSTQPVKKQLNPFEMMKRQTNIAKKTTEAEIRISSFLIEQDISFNTADHLCSLIKSLDPDSQVLKNIRCNRTKATLITQNVIGLSSFEELIELLKITPFSLIIDESTDRSSTKHLAMTARLVLSDPTKYQFYVRNIFLGLLAVEKSDAVTLYSSIVQFFTENGILYKTNLIGFASDGANVMVGRKNSVATLLKNDVNNLIVFKCICHSLTLCASHATKQLPNAPEQMLRETYSYLSHSSKRLICAQQFQKLLDVKPHKILKLYDVRWLLLTACIDRFLEQHDVLLAFFLEEAKTNEDAANIYKNINDPYNVLYLKFLQNVLKNVVDRNLEFQSEQPKLTGLYNKMETMYVSILSRYLKEEYLDKCRRDPLVLQNCDPAYFVNLENLDLGVKVDAALTILSNDPRNATRVKLFRTKCLNFLIELAKQIYLRFPFADDHIRGQKHLNFLDPKHINEVKSLGSFTAYFSKYIKFDEEDAEREYKDFCIHFKDNIIMDQLKFWAKVESTRNASGDPLFPNMLKIAKFIFTLPHSSAACERVFSAVNRNKTKARCRLDTKSLTGILHGKRLLQVKGASYDFEISNRMIHHM